MHTRTLIRQTLVNRLMQRTAAGDRVYAMRVQEIDPAEGYPVLVIDTPSERAVPHGLDTQRVELDVMVTVLLPADQADWHNRLDGLCDNIERLLPYTLTSLDALESVEYTGTQIDVTDHYMGVATLSYTVTYYRVEPPATEAQDLSDFDTVAYGIDPAPVDGQVMLEGQIDFKTH